MFCMKLYFAAPKTYKSLCATFCLPTSRTFQRTIHNLQISPTLHDSIFNILKMKVTNFDDISKLCVTIIDEASFKTNLFYNKSG